VESAAAAFAAERAGKEEIDELEALVGAIDGREDEFEAYRAGDARFHIGIARAAHSPRLLGAVTEVQAAMTEVLDVIIYHSMQVLGHSTDYHWRILDAIRAHDSEAARRSMLDHVMATENVLYGLVPEITPDA
jgi:DNA-binding GntR family transcriptional regulator